MSIKSIYFENYKAFKSAEINLDRLSILLGTNSSGKSSIIKLILMLSQSSSSFSNKNLITTGDLIDLGDVENIFHNQDVKKDIEIEIKISSQDIAPYIDKLESAVEIMFRNIVRERYSHFSNYSDSMSLTKKVGVDYLELRSEHHSLSEKADMVKALLRKLPINKDHFSDDNDYLESIEYLNFGQGKIDALINLFSEMKKINSITSFGYTLSYYNRGIIIRKLYIKDGENIALQADLINWKTKKKQITFSSDIIDCRKINKEKSNTKKRLCMRGLKLGWVTNSSSLINRTRTIAPNSRVLTSEILTGGVSYLLSGMFNSIIIPSLRDISSHNIRHVGPLRFQPKRFFLIENNNNIHLWNTSDGEKLSSILHNNKIVKNQINIWLKRFDLEVDISQIKNVIHSIKVKDKGLNLDITDVGFGVSQVLPVILQPYLASNAGIIIIEQPEVHIHPKMQSELADFFISIIKNSDKRFIIETHSEAFLKRLRRRISEYGEGLETSISHKDVAIQFVEKRESKKGTASINNVSISPTGMFEWPKDFKDNDIEDSIEFMKRQG